MTTSQSELLDLALDNWQKDPGMGFARTLQGDGSAIDRMVAAAEMVQALPALPVPDQVQARADREAFMARVQQLPPPAIPVEKSGFLAWLTQLLTASAQTRNEPRPMVPVFAKAVFILIAVVFFSLGGTAVLSASALPTSPIYPVKLVLEEARLSLTGSPAGQTALHLDFAAERAQEMARLAAFKLAPDQAQLQNFRAHWRQALLLAGELPDEDLLAQLTQAQALAGDQERLLAGAQSGLPLDMQGASGGSPAERGAGANGRAAGPAEPRSLSLAYAAPSRRLAGRRYQFRLWPRRLRRGL